MKRGVERLGLKPLQPELERIAKIQNKNDLVDTIAHLHEITPPAVLGGGGAGGARPVFAFGARQDFHDARQMIAVVDQSGLGLPDRDYYFKTDPKSVETRKRYVEYVQKMLQLLGDPPEAAAKSAQSIMELETDLAKSSMDRVQRRDPHNLDHKMKRDELANLAPGFGFERYFSTSGAPPFTELNVSNPDFFRKLNALFDSVPLERWKSYLRWHLVRIAAPTLPGAFVKQQFAFESQVLTGQKEIESRWKRCAKFTDRDLGEALGKPFVETAFGVEGKERTQKMVQAIEAALGKDIQTLPWMTEATKKRALEKLKAIANKIGYPEKWRDYGAVKVARNEFFGNVSRAAEFEHKRRVSKIGQPVDRLEWNMTPPTVNAYYSSSLNDINFPAGILQPPFYDTRIDDAINYGGIGAVIGHELTHGFDDQGRKFDAEGNLKDWWSDADGKEFEKRASCIADEYAQFVAVRDPPNDVMLNGKLTLGENTADNGGLRIALMALRDMVAGKRQEPIDGYTPEQRVFLGFAGIWCQNQTKEHARTQALTDPHSLGQYRVNGVVQNMPEFQTAFSCKADQPMVRKNPCRVW